MNAASRELRDPAAWAEELAPDLAATRCRSGELTRSLMSLMPVLPRDDRRALKIGIAKPGMPKVRFTARALHRTEIADAVRAYLAAAAVLSTPTPSALRNPTAR